MNRTPDRARLTAADVEDLGIVAGWRWVRWQGNEYLLSLTPMAADHVAQPIGRGEIRIATPRERLEYGTPMQYTETVRGEMVPDGSYAAAVTRDALSRPRGPKPPRPIDLVSRQVALRGTADRIFPVADRKFSDLNLEAELATMPGAPIAGFLPGTPAASDDPAAIVARLARRGVALSVTPGGRLLAVTSGGHIPDDLLSVLVGCERLLVAELMETPLLCEAGPHAGPVPKAVTTLAVNVPSCRGHADGSLPLTVDAA